jgi:hypothetical protein
VRRTVAKLCKEVKKGRPTTLHCVPLTTIRTLVLLSGHFFRRFSDTFPCSEEAVRRTVAELRKEMLEDGLGQPAKRDYSWRNRKREAKPHRVVGRACDVSDSADVRQLAAFAQKSFGHVDLWVSLQLFLVASLVALKAHGLISSFVF